MNFLKFKKIIVLPLIVSLLFSGVFLATPTPAQAQLSLVETNDLASFAINWILVPILDFESYVLAVVGTFLDKVMQPEKILEKTVVVEGWRIMRDFSNMFFILILLAIALSFILFPRYQLKNALPKMLLVALLINFSLPIAGIFIDLANVFTAFFMKQVSSSGNLSEIIASQLNITGIYDLSSSPFFQTPQGEDALTSFVMQSVIFGIIFQFILIFIFVALGVMFFIRNIYIYFLLVLLPLALVASIIDNGKFKMWTSNFIKWTFFAPVAAFFIYLSLISFRQIIGSQADALVDLQLDVSVLSRAFDYLVITGLLIGSLFAANYLGIGMAGGSINMLNNMKRMATGGLKKGGKNLGRIGLYGGQKMGLGKVSDIGADMLSVAGRNKFIRATGVGVLAGGASRGLRRLNTKSRSFIESRGALSSAEKTAWDNMTDKEKLEYYKDIKATNAHKASILAREMVENPKGNLLKGSNDEETFKLKQEAYKQAKATKDVKTQKSLEKSDVRLFNQRMEEEYKNVPDGAKNPKTGKTRKDEEKAYYSGFSPADVKNMSREMLEYENGILLKKMNELGRLNGEYFKSAIRENNTDFLNAFEKLRKEGHITNEEIKKENKRLYDWLHSNAAQGIVNVSLNDANYNNGQSFNDVKNKIKEIKEKNNR